MSLFNFSFELILNKFYFRDEEGEYIFLIC